MTYFPGILPNPAGNSRIRRADVSTSRSGELVVAIMFAGDHFSGTDTTIRRYGVIIRGTLIYHARRLPNTGSGHWDDDGHPGVTVYGNNIQAENNFFTADRALPPYYWNAAS